MHRTKKPVLLLGLVALLAVAAVWLFGGVGSIEKAEAADDINGTYDVLATSPTGYFHCIARIEHNTVTDAVNETLVCYTDNPFLQTNNYLANNDAMGVPPTSGSGPPPPPPYGYGVLGHITGTYTDATNTLAFSGCGFRKVTLGQAGPAVYLSAGTLTFDGAKTSATGSANIHLNQTLANCMNGTPGPNAPIAGTLALTKLTDPDTDNDTCTDDQELNPDPNVRQGRDPYNPNDCDKNYNSIFHVLAELLPMDITKAATPQPIPGAYFHCVVDVQELHPAVDGPDDTNTTVDPRARPMCYTDFPGTPGYPDLFLVLGSDTNPHVAGVKGDGRPNFAPPSNSQGYAEVHNTHTTFGDQAGETLAVTVVTGLKVDVTFPGGFVADRLEIAVANAGSNQKIKSATAFTKDCEVAKGALKKTDTGAPNYEVWSFQWVKKCIESGDSVKVLFQPAAGSSPLLVTQVQKVNIPAQGTVNFPRFLNSTTPPSCSPVVVDCAQATLDSVTQVAGKNHIELAGCFGTPTDIVHGNLGPQTFARVNVDGDTMYGEGEVWFARPADAACTEPTRQVGRAAQGDVEAAVTAITAKAPDHSSVTLDVTIEAGGALGVSIYAYWDTPDHDQRGYWLITSGGGGPGPSSVNMQRLPGQRCDGLTEPTGAAGLGNLYVVICPYPIQVYLAEQGKGADTDRDNCSDKEELSDSGGIGGLRDPLNWGDFMSVHTGATLVKDKSVSIGDISAIVARFGSNDTGPGTFNRNSDPKSTPLPTTSTQRERYHPSYDRGGPVVNGNVAGSVSRQLPADAGVGAGSITIGDISAAVAQFGHNCVAAP